ncbi:50S ribosomal protein L17 [Chlamydiota bacterium]
MRHKKKTFKLKRTSAHRKALMANLFTSLVKYEKINTTMAKAKALKSFADKLVSLAKRGDLSARRRIAKTVKEKEVLRKLFNDIAPKYMDKNGGYCRIINVGRRNGDNAPLSILEFVSLEVEEVREGEKGKKKAAKKSNKPAPAENKEETKPEVEKPSAEPAEENAEHGAEPVEEPTVEAPKEESSSAESFDDKEETVEKQEKKESDEEPKEGEESSDVDDNVGAGSLPEEKSEEVPQEEKESQPEKESPEDEK